MTSNLTFARFRFSNTERCGPILMSGPMVRATLREINPKTQTRRMVKTLPQPFTGANSIEPNEGYPGEWSPWKDGERQTSILCPYGVPGDRLWVRETWQRGRDFEVSESPFGIERDRIYYRADQQGAYAISGRPWRPGIHLRREHSRITLELTDVRVERLQEITAEDAKAEGAPYYVGGEGPVSEAALRCEPGYWHGIEGYRQGFEHLWGEINGWQGEPKARCRWQSNPWVWALTFKRITP